MNSVILSQQASRFWIPFDVKLFESNSPCFFFNSSIEILSLV